MIEGRRAAARRRRATALSAVAMVSLVGAVAALLLASVGDDVGQPDVYAAGVLALAGWTIAVGLAYLARPMR